jgi:hypothetical protein
MLCNKTATFWRQSVVTFHAIRRHKKVAAAVLMYKRDYTVTIVLSCYTVFMAAITVVYACDNPRDKAAFHWTSFALSWVFLTLLWIIRWLAKNWVHKTLWKRSRHALWQRTRISLEDVEALMDSEEEVSIL